LDYDENVLETVVIDTMNHHDSSSEKENKAFHPNHDYMHHPHQYSNQIQPIPTFTATTPTQND